MRSTVERSQSLRADLERGSGTDSPSSLRPKVSFNRAVHVKRISRRLADVLEDEDSPDYSDVTKKPPMAANGYSTLPRRGSQNSTPTRNGTKKSETPAPSDRLSKLIRHEPKPEESNGSSQTSTNSATMKKKKKTLSERVRGMFSPKRNSTPKEPTEDELKTRYTEFKGRNSSSDATDNEVENHRYTSKRRGSAPESRASWFRSIERLNKAGGASRKERYFGESDREWSESPRRRPNESSAESANEQEGMGRAPSLVYLHTAAVGDIPHRPATPSKKLSRSVSVLAPWAPKSRPPRPTRTRATQTESPSPTRRTYQSSTLLRPPSSASRQSRSLPKLVFTGPSIEETVGRTTLQRSNIQMRSRK